MHAVVDPDDLVHGPRMQGHGDAHSTASTRQTFTEDGARFADHGRRAGANLGPKTVRVGPERLDDILAGKRVAREQQLPGGCTSRLCSARHGASMAQDSCRDPSHPSIAPMTAAVSRCRAQVPQLVALLLAVSASVACKERADRPGRFEQGKDEAQVLQVETLSLEPARIERHYRTSGTLKAIQEAEIVATQAAIIQTIAVDEGDTVQEGQLLARLDGRDLKLQAAAAGLQVDNLERELERLESISREAIAAEEVDKQRYAVEEARVSAKLSRHQAKQTVIRAPFSGTVIERLVDKGNLATTATPLLRLADLSVLELELHLPERDAATIELDTDVAVELVDGTRFTAKVTRKAPMVDELTGTVKFTVQADAYPEGAMPGAFARASVLVAARDAAPSLARSAVFEIEGKPHVYVLVDGKARRRAVELGLEGSERVEVLSGLSNDDVVVADGNAGITEGMPLRAAVAEQAAADKIAGEPQRRPGA